MLPPIGKHIQNRFHGRHAPFSIVHFVTNRCNARCSHCFMDFRTGQDRTAELTLDEIRLLAGSLGRGLYNVNLTGGEPFIRDDMAAIVECYASETPAQSIVITTNGWFTDDIRRCAERIASHASTCRITFSISLDDIGERHDAGRQLVGLYNRALESYLMLRSWADPRIDTTIALTVTPANAPRIEAIHTALREAGVISIFPVLFRGEGVQRDAADRASLCRAYARLSHLIDDYNETSAGKNIADAAHRAKNRIVRGILGDPEQADRFHVPCTAGSLFGTIMADGSVTPCELLASRYPLGNLRECNMDFSAIWNSTLAEQARQMIRNSRCHCTFECAWTVNVLARTTFWPRLAGATLREML